jgi:adenosine deaminase
VVKLAVERDVTFDVCPISNIRLRAVDSWADHPIRRLMQAGVRCTVSTDDPLTFANSVNEEYAALANELALTRAELAQVAKNGWAVADVSASSRRAHLDEIDRLVS